MIEHVKKLFSVRIDRGSPEENFFISSGMEFYGDLVARSSSGRIDGRFEGHIIECKRIIIGPDAMIKGNVFAEDIMLYGYCEGNLFATGDVKVFNSAVILGDIHASSLLVEKDSTFRGNVKKLKVEDMAAFAAREKDKIIQQGRSNVHNIYSLQAKAESEVVRARKVANAGSAEFADTENRPAMKRVQGEVTLPEKKSVASVPKQKVLDREQMPNPDQKPAPIPNEKASVRKVVAVPEEKVLDREQVPLLEQKPETIPNEKASVRKPVSVPVPPADAVPAKPVEAEETGRRWF